MAIFNCYVSSPEGSPLNQTPLNIYQQLEVHAILWMSTCNSSCLFLAK